MRNAAATALITSLLLEVFGISLAVSGYVQASSPRPWLFLAAGVFVLLGFAIALAVAGTTLLRDRPAGRATRRRATNSCAPRGGRTRARMR